MSFKLNQMALFSAINNEICRQVPGIPAEPRLMNAVIAAANTLVDEFAKPIVKAREGMGLEAWLDSDDTGASSLYMAWCLSGGQFMYWQGREIPELAYPHDSDDFGRCLRMVRAVPGFEEKIDVMLGHGVHWRAVVSNWQDWASAYDDGDKLFHHRIKAAYGEA